MICIDRKSNIVKVNITATSKIKTEKNHMLISKLNHLRVRNTYTYNTHRNSKKQRWSCINE